MQRTIRIRERQGWRVGRTRGGLIADGFPGCERRNDPVIEAAIYPRTLAERAYAQIKNALIVGRFTPGQRITLRSLCAQLGTSVTPVREALLRLTAASALESRVRAVGVPILSPSDLNELMDLRLALEGLALRCHEPDLHRIEDMSRLHSRIEAMLDSADIIQFATVAHDLRVGVLRLERNSVLSSLIDRIWCRLGPSFTQSLAEPAMRYHLVKSYAYIIAAVERDDLAAAGQAFEQEIQMSLSVLHRLSDYRIRPSSAGFQPSSASPFTIVKGRSL